MVTKNKRSFCHSLSVARGLVNLFLFFQKHTTPTNTSVFFVVIFKLSHVMSCVIYCLEKHNFKTSVRNFGKRFGKFLSNYQQYFLRKIEKPKWAEKCFSKQRKQPRVNFYKKKKGKQIRRIWKNPGKRLRNKA